jgi:hypothetical protein
MSQLDKRDFFHFFHFFQSVPRVSRFDWVEAARDSVFVFGFLFFQLFSKIICFLKKRPIPALQLMMMKQFLETRKNRGIYYMLAKWRGRSDAIMRWLSYVGSKSVHEQLDNWNLFLDYVNQAIYNTLQDYGSKGRFRCRTLSTNGKKCSNVSTSNHELARK